VLVASIAGPVISGLAGCETTERKLQPSEPITAP
jgi:hypothetical protein